MKAIVLHNYNNNLIRAILGLNVEEIPMPKPSGGEVLIKVQAAPCNPSDIAFLRGVYNIKKPLPAIPGFEGTGTITFVGPGVSNDLIGKRVSCFIQNDNCGTWSEYVVAKADKCIILDERLPMKQAACFAINPFTAYGLLMHALHKESGAIIQNAAGGQIGKYIRILAKKENIKTINIVRKEEHIALLKAEGEEYVLGINDSDFAAKLKELANRLKATLAIDAVGGECSGHILNSMPKDSELILYGGLSGVDISTIDSLGIIFKRKTMRGFNLMDWTESLKEGEFEKISAFLQGLFIEGILKTEIQLSCTFQEIAKGIRTYISNMSAGKILIKPE